MRLLKLLILIFVFHSCKENQETNLPIESSAENFNKNYFEVDKDSISVDGKVNQIKAELAVLPFYPPSDKSIKSEKYQKKSYGLYWPQNVVYFDQDSIIKMISESYVCESFTRYAYYYFDEDELSYAYVFLGNGLIDFTEEDGNHYYFNKEKLIFWITEDVGQGNIFTQNDSTKMKEVDLQIPEKAERGNIIIKDAYEFLEEGKLKIRE